MAGGGGGGRAFPVGGGGGGGGRAFPGGGGGGGRGFLGGGGGLRGSGARPSPRPASRSENRDPPSVPAPSGGGGSLAGVVAEGMAFGTGTSVAHRAVDAVMGPRTINHEIAATPADTANSHDFDQCEIQAKSFQDCLNNYNTKISKCQFYMNMLVQCRKNIGGNLSEQFI